MTKIVLTENAQNNIAGIIKYIAEDNPIRAKSYVKELLQKASNTITAFPLSCPLYNHDLNIRRFVYQRYNVYYRFEQQQDTAYILYVFNSAKESNYLLKDN